MKNLGNTFFLKQALAFFLLNITLQAFALDDTRSFITFSSEGDDFPLVSANRAASLYIGSDDDPGVIRAAKDLQNDIRMVSSIEPGIFTDDFTGKGAVVVIGTLGTAHLDYLIKKQNVDITPIQDKWEAYLITTVKTESNDFMFIIGSDRRGTIFGIYELSAQIGVSPWYWWADVPIKQHEELFVKQGVFTDMPEVKYRGIFLNDEAPALTGWSGEKFGGFNHKFYVNVFELILRLKGNFLWPAMWGSAFYDDDALNPKLADEYGVVIGTSHHEPMMRAHAEWARYGKGPWNYDENPENLQKFWRESIEQRNDFEALITVGMRGDGDMAMTEGTAIGLLQRIIEDQRKILKEVTGQEPDQIPQVWALYKEVQDYYNKGMRVPEDITLLLCDDNWGNVRVLPKPGTPERVGGYGMYYHFDFVGGPVSYRWLNVTPVSRTWEQMNLTWEHGVDRLWVVNVGDLKPMEIPISFFLEHAWDPEGMTAERMGEWTLKWALENFGSGYAEEIAGLIKDYTRFNYRRTPEMLSPETYSLKDYREFETVVAEYNELYRTAMGIGDKLPDEYQSAFYQLVIHPIEACSNLNEMYYTTGLNRLYAEQGRTSANMMAERVKELFVNDSLIEIYYHHDLARGKWNHFMSQTHIGYTSWNNPPFNYMPKVKEIEVPEEGSLGVMPEGSLSWWPEAEGSASLPEFDNLNKQEFYIELFNRGKSSVSYMLEAADPWIQLSAKDGLLEADERILVSIDWTKAPAGRATSSISISSEKEEIVKVEIPTIKHPPFVAKNFEGFMEANGYVSMEAAHFTGKTETESVEWKEIPEFGRTLSGMTVMPTIHEPVVPGGDNPCLEYKVYINNPGTVRVKVHVAPSLNIYNDEGMKYATSFDNGKPVICKIHEFDTIPDWEYPAYWNISVTDNTRILTTEHSLEKAGPHTLKLWMVTPGVVFEKIVIETMEIGESYLGPPESYFITKSGEGSK